MCSTRPMGRQRGRGLDPDRALEISLNANARRLATDYSPMAEAVAELKAMASGRADLLGRAAGQHIGGYLARPGVEHPAIPYAAALLILAGADPDVIAEVADQTRKNATGSRYSL